MVYNRLHWVDEVQYLNGKHADVCYCTGCTHRFDPEVSGELVAAIGQFPGASGRESGCCFPSETGVRHLVSLHHPVCKVRTHTRVIHNGFIHITCVL